MKALKYYFHRLFFRKPKDLPGIIKTKGIEESFEFLKRKIAKHKRLFFVRFGDGEFVTLMRKNHRNYVYNANLDTELEASSRIEHEEYLIALPINYRYDEYHSKGIYKNFPWQDDMVRVVEQKNFATDIVFENPCIFQCMAVFKPLRLKCFLDKEIRSLKKMFIGSTEKEIAEKLYGRIDFYVKIPVKNAYETINDWWKEVEKNANKVELIIPSAGSTSNVIALRLWNRGISCKVIDFGSITDAVEYKESRTWIRLQGHKIREVLNKVDKEKLSLQKRFLFLRRDIKFYFRNQIM